MYIRKELIDMTTSIQKWGNSQGVRIPKYLLDAVKMSTDDEINIRAEGNVLIIEKAKPAARKTIKELFADYDGEYTPQEIDWGEKAGKEEW